MLYDVVLNYTVKDDSSAPNLLKTALIANTEIMVKMLKREGRPLEIVWSKPHFILEKLGALSALPKVPHLGMGVCTKILVFGIHGRILSNATCCLTLKGQ